MQASDQQALENQTFIVGDPSYHNKAPVDIDENEDEDQPLFNNKQVDYVAQQMSRSDGNNKVRTAALHAMVAAEKLNRPEGSHYDPLVKA